MIARLAQVGANSANLGGAAGAVLSMMDSCGFGRLVTQLHGAAATHVCLPSAMIGCIHDSYPQKFQEIFGIHGRNLGDFWATLRQDPWFESHVRTHGVLRHFNAAQWRRLVPLTVHEDAGPYTKKLSTNIVSFSSFFGAGGEKVSQFVVASYIKEGSPSIAEVGNLWDPILADSDNLLSTGVGDFLFLPIFKRRPGGTG